VDAVLRDPRFDARDVDGPVGHEGQTDAQLEIQPLRTRALERAADGLLAGRQPGVERRGRCLRRGVVDDGLPALMRF